MNYSHTIGIYLEVSQLALSLSLFPQHLAPTSERGENSQTEVLPAHGTLINPLIKQLTPSSDPPGNSSMCQPVSTRWSCPSCPWLGRDHSEHVSTAPLAGGTVLWEETAPALYNLSTAVIKIALKAPCSPRRVMSVRVHSWRNQRTMDKFPQDRKGYKAVGNTSRVGRGLKSIYQRNFVREKWWMKMSLNQMLCDGCCKLIIYFPLKS